MFYIPLVLNMIFHLTVAIWELIPSILTLRVRCADLPADRLINNINTTVVIATISTISFEQLSTNYQSDRVSALAT